jgi:hypothetical protein
MSMAAPPLFDPSRFHDDVDIPRTLRRAGKRLEGEIDVAGASFFISRMTSCEVASTRCLLANRRSSDPWVAR